MMLCLNLITHVLSDDKSEYLVDNLPNSIIYLKCKNYGYYKKLSDKYN